MTLLDAYALVAVLADEPAAGEVARLLEDGCSVTVVNLAEALDVVQRRYAIAEDLLRTGLEPLFGTQLAVHDCAADDAWQAAAIRGRHYDARTSALSVADCLLIAAAARSSVAVATADPPLARAARHEDVDVIALPDSTGARP